MLKIVKKLELSCAKSFPSFVSFFFYSSFTFFELHCHFLIKCLLEQKNAVRRNVQRCVLAENQRIISSNHQWEASLALLALVNKCV